MGIGWWPWPWVLGATEEVKLASGRAGGRQADVKHCLVISGGISTAAGLEEHEEPL